MTPQEHIEQDLAETLEKQRLEKEKLEKEKLEQKKIIDRNAALLLECLNRYRSERPKKDSSSADSKDVLQLPARDSLLDAFLPKAIRHIVLSYLGTHFVASLLNFIKTMDENTKKKTTAFTQALTSIGNLSPSQLKLLTALSNLSADSIATMSGTAKSLLQTREAENVFLQTMKFEDQVFLEQFVADSHSVFEETAKRQIMELFYFANQHYRDPKGIRATIEGLDKLDSSASWQCFMDRPNEFIRICSDDKSSKQLVGRHLPTLWDIFNYLFTDLLLIPQVLLGDYQPNPPNDFIADKCMPLLCAAYALSQLDDIFQGYIQQTEYHRAILTLDAGLEFNERHLTIIESRLVPSRGVDLADFPPLLFDKVKSQQPHFFTDPKRTESLGELINGDGVGGVGALQAARYLVQQGTPLPSNIQNQLVKSLYYCTSVHVNAKESAYLKSSNCALLKALFAREDFLLQLKKDGVYIELLEDVISIASDQKEIMTTVEKLLRDPEVKIHQPRESKDQKDNLLAKLIQLAVESNLPDIVSCLLKRGAFLPRDVITECPNEDKERLECIIMDRWEEPRRTKKIKHASVLEWAYARNYLELFTQIAAHPGCSTQWQQEVLRRLCVEDNKEFLNFYLSTFQNIASASIEKARAWVDAIVLPLMKVDGMCGTAAMQRLLEEICKKDPRCFDDTEPNLWKEAIKKRSSSLLKFLIDKKVKIPEGFEEAASPLHYAVQCYNQFYLYYYNTPMRVILHLLLTHPDAKEWVAKKLKPYQNSLFAFPRINKELSTIFLDYPFCHPLLREEGMLCSPIQVGANADAKTATSVNASADQKDINGGAATKKAVTAMTVNGTVILQPANPQNDTSGNNVASNNAPAPNPNAGSVKQREAPSGP